MHISFNSNAPGVRKKVAEAICGAGERLGDAGNVSVILDVSEEVCRIGFGDIEGLRILQQNRLICGRLSAQEGVRIGILITDEDTLIYTPTALLQEAELLHQGRGRDGEVGRAGACRREAQGEWLRARGAAVNVNFGQTGFVSRLRHSAECRKRMVRRNDGII